MTSEVEALLDMLDRGHTSTSERAAVLIRVQAEEIASLRLALRNVCADASALLALHEPEIRGCAGNTNFTVLLTRVTEGFAVLALKEGGHD